MALKLGSLFFDIGADTKPLKKGMEDVERETGKATKSFSRLGGVIAAVVSVEAARRLLMLADGVRVLDTRLRNLTKTQKEYEKSSTALITTANDTGQAFKDVVVFFERSTRALEDLGATNDQVLQFTDTIQKLGVLGGNSVDEIANGTRQLNQSLQGGIVRAEEFNSIVENTPMIAQAIADELGKSTGELRKMVLEGKLTSEKVFGAILKQSDSVNKNFGEFPRSIEQASNALKNEFGQALAEIDKQLGGVSESTAGIIDRFARGFKKIRESLQEMDREGVIDDTKEKITKLTNEYEFLARTTFHAMNMSTTKGAQARATMQALGLSTEAAGQKMAILKEQISALTGEYETLTTKQKESGGNGTGPTSRRSKRKTDTEGVDQFNIDVLGDQFAAIEAKYQEHEDRLSEIVITSATERARLEKELEAQKNEELASLQAAQVAQTIAGYQSILGVVGDFASTFGQVLAASGNKNKAIMKAAFIAQKAIDVLSIVSSTNVAAAKAMALDPTGATSARITTLGYANAAMTAGLGLAEAVGGRQQGGPTSPNSLYNVNENGAPEMFVQGNKQFLMTGSRGGKVISGGDMMAGGGGAPSVTVINNTGISATATTEFVSKSELRIILNAERAKTGVEVERNIAAGIEQNNGVVNNAMNNNTQQVRRLS